MAGADAPGPVRNPFPFNHKPNPLDRDHLLIPAGWDSWGKIEIVRSFEPRVWGDAWDRDIEGDDTDEEPGAQTLFASLVPDQGTKVRFILHISSLLHLNIFSATGAARLQ